MCVIFGVCDGSLSLAVVLAGFETLELGVVLKAVLHFFLVVGSYHGFAFPVIIILIASFGKLPHLILQSRQIDEL